MPSAAALDAFTAAPWIAPGNCSMPDVTAVAASEGVLTMAVTISPARRCTTPVTCPPTLSALCWAAEASCPGTAAMLLVTAVPRRPGTAATSAAAFPAAVLTPDTASSALALAKPPTACGKSSPKRRVVPLTISCGKRAQLEVVRSTCHCTLSLTFLRGAVTMPTAALPISPGIATTLACAASTVPFTVSWAWRAIASLVS
mmetsp:Transcript_122077/g.272891  ORF Transcript_122077/g.272891 Transcript_122077/m.272891 type:complete len:201 (+) Transcript_122077:474-1076(+)